MVYYKSISPYGIKRALLFIYIFMHLSLHAQILPIKTFNVHNGLGGNGVYAVLRDARGVLWVGTNNGINWYDGNRFTQPAIIAPGGQLYVNRLFEDSRLNIWACTFYNGLYKYNISEHRFYNFYIDPAKPEANCNNVLGITELFDHRLLVATDENAYFFDGQHFTVFDTANKELVAQIATVAQLGNGDILLGAIQGVYWYKRTKSGWIFYKHIIPTTTINHIFVDAEACWLATTKGLLYYANSDVLAESYPSKIYSAGQAMNYVTKDKTGAILAGGELGALKIIHDSAVNYSVENGLPGYNIHSVYRDFENNLWFATDNGLARLSDEFYSYYTLSERSPLAVMSGLKHENTLWIGYLGGLRKINGNKTQDFTTINGRRLSYTFFVTPDKKGQLWVGTDIGIYNIQGNKFTLRYPERASCMYEDETGTIWFGCQDGAILYYKDTVFHEAKYWLEKKENVETIYRDEQGFLWIGLFRFGVRRCRILNDTLIVTSVYSDKNGFENLRVRSFLYDKKGHLIFGSRTNGIYIIPVNDSSARSVININANKGLHATWIKGMTMDEVGNILMASNTGLHILSGNNYRDPVIKAIPFANEKVPLEMNAIFKDGDGFWLGTTGIIHYVPALQVKDTIRPLVYITQVSVAGKADTAFQPYELVHRPLFLRYNQNVLSFDFTAISLKDEKSVRYKYKLEGRDASWSEPTDHRYISYGSLPPGQYTFKVIACNADGVWSNTPAFFSFTIRNPFWKTWWFISLVVLIAGAMMYAFYRYRLNKILQLERLRMKISTDLHDDIGSTLSSISILSDMVIRETASATPNLMVKEIKDNSLMLMEKMDDIVWSINPQNDSFENLLIRIKRFATQVFEARGIDYDLEIQDNLAQFKLPMQFRQHIYLIMKEAINNLVKYSQCTRAIIVVSYHHHELRVLISDNGTGFDTNNPRRGNGLLNMQHRANSMKAVLAIESAPNQGTTVELKVKIK